MQSFRDFTHYIIDDSEDAVTSGWIENNTQRQTIFIKNPENMGSNYSKNQALDMIFWTSHHDESYVIFLDDDDFLSENALKCLSEKISQEKKNWYLTRRCYKNGAQITEAIRWEGEYDYIQDYLLGKSLFWDATHIISSILLTDIRFPSDIKNGEEWIFFLQVARKSKIQFLSLVTTLSDWYLSDGLTLAKIDIAFRKKMLWRMYQLVWSYFPEVFRGKILLGILYYFPLVWHSISYIKRIWTIKKKYLSITFFKWFIDVVHMTLRKFIDNPLSIFAFLKKYLYSRFVADSMINHYTGYKFLDYGATLDYAVENNMTLIRFGDELFDMLQWLWLYFDNWHQKHSKSLEEWIKRILTEQDDRILLCFNPEFILKSKSQFEYQWIGNEWQLWINSKMYLYKYLQKGRIYGSALLFHLRYNAHFDFQKLWRFLAPKNVIIIVTKSSRFHDCKIGMTTDFIEAPQNDAWDAYDEMKQAVLELIKKKWYKKENVLVLGSASSATKILAWDLHMNHDIVSWDTGQFFDLAAKQIQELGHKK
jgi:hypothetical protein